MLSRFFIDRPVFATVLAILMLLVGFICLPLLSVEQYPDIAPPVVQVTANYPGADPQTVVDTVTAPLEQEINGVEGMIYMKSTTDASGRVSIDVTFALGSDPDQAAVYTQNRVAIAEPRLPAEVRSRGVTTRKRSPSLLMVVSLFASADEAGKQWDQLALSNYMTIFVKDELARVDGVGEVFVFGAQDYSMRVWLDPDELASRDLTTVDVLNALREQNVQVAAGQIGQEPAKTDSGFQLTINTQGRLESVEQFEDIILKVGDDQRVVRLKDIARVELGAESYDWFAQLNGQPAATVGIYQLPGSNAVETARGIRQKLDELSVRFPQGVEHKVTFDFTEFVRASIREVVITLFIAAGLVILITYIFLQSWRATLVPAITIPVSLIATFGVMLPAGFSLNLFTLFGLILAIGIVVDDAIVVVENTSRKIDEGLEPREAAKQAMDEVAGALVATTLVVLAVFIPAACLGGLTGVLYRQFALTIAFATAFSTINALTLSPALCAIFLRPSRTVRFPLFVWFNGLVNGTRNSYIWIVGKGIRLSVIVVLVFGGFCFAAVWGLRTVPTGFLPNEDQGYFFVNVQLPDAAKLGRTREVLDRIEKLCLSTPGVRDVVGIGGYSILGGTVAPNNAACVVVLENWDDRPVRTESVRAIIGKLAPQFAQIQEAVVFPFAPPPIIGLGSAGGFAYELLALPDVTLDELQDTADQLVARGNADPELTRLFTGFRARVPQLYVDINETKAQRIGVSPNVYNDTLQSNLGGAYVNDFNRFNRVYRVYVQADSQFRDSQDDIGLLKVRNQNGQTLPMDTFIEVEEVVGPQSINRYNLYPSASITGSAAPGFSSGQAVARMAELSAEVIPPGSGFFYDWTGTTYQEIKAGNAAPIAFALGFVVVFLVLAAQYESWTIPLAILLTVPLGVLGALIGIAARGYDNNIYTQVGFVLLIALVAKNAILIVEFARELRREGRSIRDAALEASRLRYRPILMTAFSFVLGTFPLIIALGAGAQSRRSLGTTVFFGMIFATVIGILFVPVFFYLLQSLVEKTRGVKAASGANGGPAG